MERVTPVITKDGIGEVKLGKTLTELKILFPLAKFESQEDGDGVTWFEFTTETGDTMSLYVGDWDSTASVMWNKGIETIQIFSTKYATESGLRIDYSGIFTEGTRSTQKYEEAGKIHSISISTYH